MTHTNARIAVLKELVQSSHYVVDPDAVASAIVARRLARALVPGVGFACEPAPPAVQSFRPDPNARSFRLCRGHNRRRGGVYSAPSTA